MTEPPEMPPPHDIEAQKLELERYKARLDYKKFLWGSVAAAIAIATIPPSFQLATAFLEKVKADKKLEVEQSAAKEERIGKYLDTALDQNIELRLRFAEYFASLSEDSAQWQSYYNKLYTQRENNRKIIENGEPEQRQAQDDPELLLRLKLKLDWAYGETNYVPPNRDLYQNPRNDNTSQRIRDFWMPDGKTVDNANAQQLQRCMDKANFKGSIPFLLYGGSPIERQKVLVCVKPTRTEIIKNIPDPQVARVRSTAEDLGATTVTVTSNGDGTSNVTAAYPNLIFEDEGEPSAVRRFRLPAIHERHAERV